MGDGSLARRWGERHLLQATRVTVAIAPEANYGKWPAFEARWTIPSAATARWQRFGNRPVHSFRKLFGRCILNGRATHTYARRRTRGTFDADSLTGGAVQART